MFHRATTTWIGIVVLAGLLPASRGWGEEEGPPDLRQVVEDLLPDGWVAEREDVPGLDRVLPGVQCWFARLLARGGYPYEKIVVAGDGRILSRSDGGILLARAQAARITARRSVEAWIVEEGADPGLAPLLETLRRRADSVGREPGGALTAAVALLDLVTFEGRFVSSTVTAQPAGGFQVAVDWRQGRATWSFEERSTWTLRFDENGSLAGLQKVQTAFEKHLRR